VRLFDGEAVSAELPKSFCFLARMSVTSWSASSPFIGGDPRRDQAAVTARRRVAAGSFGDAIVGFQQGRRSSSRHVPQGTVRRPDGGFSGFPGAGPASTLAAPISWTISRSSGKRWSASFENRTFPFTVTSKAPPSDGTSFRLLIFLL
jgi:hypothetical protein